MAPISGRLLRHELLSLLADFLDYPHPGLASTVARLVELARELAPPALPYLRTFRGYVERTPVGLLEEVYTALFDLNPVFYPYVGYQLFGETYRRSHFLIALKERYATVGLPTDMTVVPDRLSLMLRFAARADPLESSTVVQEALLPALRRMLGERVPEFESILEEEAGLADESHQLEGHSLGEVLTGGFLLALTEGQSSVKTNPSRTAYRCALVATRLLLEALWQRRHELDWDGGAEGNGHR
ncbi:hypothetical protein OO015_02575 [Thermomicrobium sp. 4228-Ro]|uniref:hypothetical protein n=1 Tax=Thermomicrobium sp. 4228-Ro TaxID=2993937 RepID=UPI0022488F2F|nr:hypothetical protein [Thermomicrobium sp. 4228-Ro]MCX2726376.1 hypothetical protein [Thermomicrobium sp. 4228-Ro]